MAVVKTLLRHGASPDQTDSNGWSSIQYGQMYPEIVQMFEEALRCKRPEVLVSAVVCFLLTHSIHCWLYFAYLC